MERFVSSRNAARRETGQTLIIALIVLGILLLLGFVFLGLVDRNVHGSSVSQTRSAANDLSEAGLRFAEAQLVSSQLGADWRGIPTGPIVSGADFTLDPDALYLRPAAVDTNGNPMFWPGTTRYDLGGPDGLGPFIRHPSDQGRSLVRVRYAPSDANIFEVSPTGPLTSPGMVHDYLQVESIGRVGVVNPNDPTTLAKTAPVQFQAFASPAAFAQSIGQLQNNDGQYVNGRHMLEFMTVGLTDQARFITNKYNVSRAADIGVPNPNTANGAVLPGVGAAYNPSGLPGSDADVGSLLTYNLGSVGITTSPAGMLPGFGGGLVCNAGLTLHGMIAAYLNQSLGDKWIVNGNINGDDNSSLTINQAQLAGGVWNTNTTTLTTAAAGSSFVSRNSNYSTDNGVLLDGMATTDLLGYSRGVGRLEPPTAFQIDPQSRTLRYYELTRDSGVSANGVNSGEFGHGQGVYVNNIQDRQIPTDENGRQNVGSQESLMNDWLNPNNGDKTSGWIGAFYVPWGAVVQLQPDGFTIQLDQGQQWFDPSGNSTGQQTLRYRIGVLNGQEYIADATETGVNGGGGSVNYSLGQPFNGVLYFEGNARVRGIIPTDVQLTLVSGATIYIDGSITKGTVGNDVTAAESSSTPYGQPIAGRLSKSALMLMAKDYIAVNTTMFTGPTSGQVLDAVNDQSDTTYYDAIRMYATGTSPTSISLQTDDLTDPYPVAPGGGYNPYDPTTWMPYAMEYTDANSGNQIPTRLLLTHTSDDGPADAAFITMDVNFGNLAQTSSSYFFPGTDSQLQFPGALATYFSGLDNTASDYLGTASASINDYGLGRATAQRYPAFESRGFNLVYGATGSQYSAANQLISATGPYSTNDPFINYVLFAPGANDLLLRPTSVSGATSNNYLLARAAQVPGDIRIEASMFAEEGSFFIIPGPWFNPNPNDTRDAYNAKVQSEGQAAADTDRLTSYGNDPTVPFYGEPLDVHVQIIGSVSENMPPTLGIQTQWMQKWAWIPGLLGGDGNYIPSVHVPPGTNLANSPVVPNFTIEYDPMLATGRIPTIENGQAEWFSSNDNPNGWVRTDAYGRALPPMPCLPVSPVPTYFGELQ